MPFLTRVFWNDGQISDIIEVDADRSIVLQVSAHHEESRQSFEVVREQIVFFTCNQNGHSILSRTARADCVEALEAG